MLQIVSGKFYTSDERRETLVRGTIYSNIRVFSENDRIETAAGSLQPSTNLAGLRTLTYELIEQYEGPIASGVISSIGAKYFLQDFSSIASFSLNAICTPDPDLLRRLVGDQPLSPNSISPPRKYVGRMFEPEVSIKDADLDQFKEFTQDLIALKRSHYTAAMRAIRNYVTGLHRIGDDIDVAYTLLVASIESLARGFDGERPDWDEFDERKRTAIDRALVGADEAIADRVRNVLLDIEHSGLARRFRSFAINSLGPSFFREEAEQELRPIGKADLIVAVAQAYAIRSRYVHELAEIPKQIKHVWDLGDLVWDGDQPVLTLHGLTRLARHLIRSFIATSPKTEQEDYEYRGDFPNVVTMALAPEYWVSRHEGFRSGHARKKLEGYLSIVVSLRMGDKKPLPDIRDLLRKYEKMLPQAKDEHRLPMIALYTLFNNLVSEEDRLPQASKTVENCEALLAPPSLEMLGVRLGLCADIPWSLSEVESLYGGYRRQKYKTSGLKLPELFEIAFSLIMAEAYRKALEIEKAISTLEDAVDDHPQSAALRAALSALKNDGNSAISWMDLLLPKPDSSQA